MEKFAERGKYLDGSTGFCLSESSIMNIPTHCYKQTPNKHRHIVDIIVILKTQQIAFKILNMSAKTEDYR